MLLSLSRLGWLTLLASGLPGFAVIWLVSDQAESNREIFQKLDSDAQREMVRKWERFQSLPTAEKEKLVRFDQQLIEHPDSAHLLSLVNQYYEWSWALSDRARADLAVASNDLRIERIKKIRMAEYTANLGTDVSTQLSAEDVGKFREWLIGFNERLRSPEVARGTPAEWLAESTTELDRLQNMLSEKSANLMRQRAEIKDGRDGRLELVWNWHKAIYRPSMATIKAFYETLSEEERTELLEKVDTPEEIDKVLRDKYLVQMGPSPLFRPPGFAGPGGQGGQGRGPGGGPRPNLGPGQGPSPRPSDGRGEQRRPNRENDRPASQTDAS